jgi:SAM-dependent methyltransferase
MLDPYVLEFVSSGLPAPPARVLEVGAGAGDLAAALREQGHEVLAIDPAGDGADVARIALDRVRERPASFDAAVAVVSLHHVEPLSESCARLAELLRPGGVLLVDEFDVDAFDERAARWWIEQRHAGGGSDHPHDARKLVADHRRDLHPVARLREELSAHFDLEEPVRGPYLYRWGLEPGLRPQEEELIVAGTIPATGARFTGTRR